MKTAICVVPVEVYEDGLVGTYAPGQTVEGDAAERLLDGYPEYFREGEE